MLRIALHVFWIMLVTSLVQAHDIYSDWKQPGNGASCCSNSDCRPVRSTQGADGTWSVWIDGQPLSVPSSRVLKMPSPDGRSHWCGSGSTTYCFVPGEIRS